MAEAASQELQLTSKAEFSEYVSSEEATCWAVVTTQAPVYVEDSSSRASLDLVAVVDKSGSMSGDKIRMVRETLKFVVNQMSPVDRLGLVLYDSNVTMVGDGLVRMDAMGKAKMLNEIKHISTGSNTNLSGGLVCGLEMIERLHPREKNEVASVLLMTDGVANEGCTTTADIIRCLTVQGRASLGIQPTRRPSQRFWFWPSWSSNAVSQQTDISQVQQRQAQSTWSTSFFGLFNFWPWSGSNECSTSQPAPVTEEGSSAPAQLPMPSSSDDSLAAAVYTFGFGAQHNAGILQAISEAANGMYYFIDSAEKIPESFADCLGGLLSTVAQNLSMELTTSNCVNIVSAFSGRDKKSSASGATCTLPLGDIQSEERRDIVLKLSLPTLESEQMEWSVLQAKLSYFNVITSTMETKEFELTVSRPSTKRKGLESDEDVDTHKNRVMAAIAMQQAMLLAEQGDMAQAQGLMQRTSDAIAQTKSSSNALCSDLLTDMFDVQEQMISTEAWSGGGRHAMRNRMQKHMAQRSNVSSDNAYTTSARKSKKMALT